VSGATSELTDIKTVLRQRGFSRLKAQIWAEFAHQVVQLYWKAADQLIDPDNWAEFRKKAGAMGKPKRGRDGVTTQIPAEDAITSEIGIRANKLRQTLPPGHFLRRHEVKFAFEALVPSDLRAGRHSKKVDFIALSDLNIDAPEIAIEAKPITCKRDIEAKYLAVDGLGCFFVDDSAYTEGPLGAMLAYTINPQGDSMQAHVLAALKTYQPKPTDIHRVNIPCAGSVHCTSHDRSNWNLEQITILHLERNFPPYLQRAD
jgi:hypothetical protein